jgi:hypothetical protein
MKRHYQRILLAFSLSAGIFVSQFSSTAVDASSRTFSQQVDQDDYQTTISKGFLGKAYGVGKNRYVCNTYVEKALESLQTTTPKTSSDTGFKDVTIRKGKKGVPTSYDWSAYKVKITYTEGTLDETTGTYLWNSTATTTTIKRHNKGTSLSNLALGDVLTYGKSGGHVALYFGEFEDMSDVVDRLVELGVYDSSDLKKQHDRYVNKSGRPIVRQYEGCGTKWRIHATNKGLLIDNAIVSKSSNGTSSFGKWSKTIESGFTVYNEIISE